MDFKKLISELNTSGVTQAEISRSIGLSHPSIIDLMEGRTLSVKWVVGDKLIKLHKRVMRNSK